MLSPQNQHHFINITSLPTIQQAELFLSNTNICHVSLFSWCHLFSSWPTLSAGWVSRRINNIAKKRWFQWQSCSWDKIQLVWQWIEQWIQWSYFCGDIQHNCDKACVLFLSTWYHLTEFTELTSRVSQTGWVDSGGWWSVRVCQMLPWWTKNSPHSINIWALVTILVPL